MLYPYTHGHAVHKSCRVIQSECMCLCCALWGFFFFFRSLYSLTLWLYMRHSCSERIHVKMLNVSKENVYIKILKKKNSGSCAIYLKEFQVIRIYKFIFIDLYYKFSEIFHKLSFALVELLLILTWLTMQIRTWQRLIMNIAVKFALTYLSRGSIHVVILLVWSI